VPDAFLETGHHRLFVTGVDVDDTVCSETYMGQSRREQILLGDAPQDLALCPGRDTCREQGGRCAIDGGVATSCHFVQRPECEPATGKAAVDRVEAERQYRFGS
jgi:hypothetical protein